MLRSLEGVHTNTSNLIKDRKLYIEKDRDIMSV